MAERRMFSKTVIESDSFLDLPATTQLLYFHFGIRADDDGFISQPKSIMRMCGCKDDDMKLLIAKDFIIPFDSGVVVVRHWHMHNYIRKDRYKETACLNEKTQLKITQKGEYFLGDSSIGQPLVNHRLPQDRIGKDRLGKVSVDKSICGKKKKQKPPRHKYGQYKNVLLSDIELSKLQSEFPNDWEEWIERVSAYCESSGRKYKNYLATIRQWSQKEQSNSGQHKANNQVSDYDRFMQQLLDA